MADALEIPVTQVIECLLCAGRLQPPARDLASQDGEHFGIEQLRRRERRLVEELGRTAATTLAEVRAEREPRSR